ncbi:hypothetical protein [Flavobacterium sp. N502536]|uniref:hypothetical protein n=1 Tax=Flavobacterium sp. N502536 TaxID=2986837 RepID=UPI0022236D19|nr:hypothetical protein [Flavobacterium sp. N502536]
MVEKGTYLSANKGQNIKLNLLENNKYELVFYSGDYKIKGDSVLFTPIDKFESGFDLAFKNDKKAKKVKIKFINPSFYSFFIGSQNGSNEVKYQRLSDIWSQENTDSASPDAEFEIDRADYLYLVCEDYKGESKISKFALPKEVSEVTINYQPDLFADLNIVGFFNKNTNELMVSERPGKDPLVFVNEKDALPERMSKVVPLEIKSIVNWTYPGKEIAESEVYAVVDSAATAADSSFVLEKYDFKLKVENNLKSALSATKESKTKFQVVVIDSKNASAKTDFEAAVKDQETQLAYTMYDSYHPEYDLYNYYLTTAEDKKWLKTNKITDTPVIVVLDSNGEVLASAKASLKEKQYHFNYYDDFYKKLQRTSGLLAFNKTVKNKKSNDTDFIQAFNKLAVLETPYDYDVESAADENPAEFKFVSTVLDKKEVAQIWKKLIETHQKDTKPNMYLVETILKEIKNQGFSKQFFSEDRVLNDADFLSIDYLIKHYDAIDTERLTFNVKEGETHLIGSLNTEIALALQQNQYVYENDALAEKKNDKTIAVYKKLINAGKGNFECYQNYFTYLAEVVDTDGSNTNYLKEFTTYFKTNLATDKGSAIEKLDEMFASIDPNSQYSYNGWNSFKEYHSNLCNSAAWTVVSKPGNTGFMKSAIGWSEYSLAVTKNNPYYLDTLAQLYYKDGQKEKAIQTQLLATKYLNSDVAEETASEIRETLTKMQNGTY